MTPLTRLGGFKVLKDADLISLAFRQNSEFLPSKFFEAISKEKISLPYITCVDRGHSCCLNIMVDSSNGMRTSQLIEERFGKIFTHTPKSIILSVFPHKNNPEITGTLLELFDQETLEPDALANSPSAISAALREEFLGRASKALFGPFNFSSYRTPADWKLAQEGKEMLYKEVVASYQEQRPKIYVLECQEALELGDEIIVMRDGEVTARFDTSVETPTALDLLEKMV